MAIDHLLHERRDRRRFQEASAAAIHMLGELRRTFDQHPFELHSRTFQALSKLHQVLEQPRARAVNVVKDVEPR